MISRALLIAFCIAAPGFLSAQDLFEFPGEAELTYSESADFSSFKLPIGPFADGFMQELVAEGPRETQAWKIQSSNPSSLQLMDALRQQLERQGFELLFECETQDCGGFDFRFGTDVVAEPQMHIDLGDFRYLAAQRLGAAIPEYVNLFVSASPSFSHVQMIRIGASGQTAASNVPYVVETDPSPPTGTIFTDGHLVLEDLRFLPGSAELDTVEYEILTELVEFLNENPGAQIILVGHTDAVGSLDSNTALSQRRAEAVVARLVALGAESARLSAKGVGYLSPRASNTTDEGRALNRRVDAVLIEPDG
ncbi:MAG: OmpA family protein [Pseudomonadota bacterium]